MIYVAFALVASPLLRSDSHEQLAPKPRSALFPRGCIWSSDSVTPQDPLSQDHVVGIDNCIDTACIKAELDALISSLVHPLVLILSSFLSYH